MITIGIENLKGGVGKTTTTVVLAQGLARKGYKVLIVDTDAQGNASDMLGLDPADDLSDLLIANKPIADCITYANSANNLAIIRSDQETAIAKTALAARHAPIDTLQNAIAPVAKYIHFCLIDTAPSLDPLGLGTLYASDYVLIPTLCEYLALDGVQKVINTIHQVNTTHGGITKLLGIIPTKYDARTREHYTHLADLADAYEALVYPIVPSCIAVPGSVTHNIPLWDYDPHGNATIAYRDILERLLRDVYGSQEN